MSIKNFITIFILVAIFVGSTMYEKINLKSGKEEVKIGVILPLTGNASLSGESNKAALMVAIDEIKSIDTKYDYKFIIEDGKLEPKTIAYVMNKLINVDKVSAVLSTYVMAHKISKIYADKAKIINVGCSWGDTIGEGLYNFNTYTATTESVKKVMEKFKKDNVKNIGIISTVSPGTSSMRNSLENIVKISDVNIVFNEQFQRGTKNFKSIISKVRNENVDVIFLATYPFEGELIIREMKMQKMNTPVTSVDVLVSFSDKSLLEGEEYVSYAVANDDWVKSYNKKTDVDISVCSTQLYNGTVALVEAFENSKTKEIKNVSKYLNNMDEFEGAAGLVKITDTNFNQVDIPLVTMKNGKMIRVRQ